MNQPVTEPTPARPLTVAWISNFPVEWLPDLPEPLRKLRRQPPATWARVLLDEFRRRTDLRVQVIVLRSRLDADVSFESGGVTFHVLKAYGPLRLASLFWLDTLIIRRQLRQMQPDLVHAWGIELGAALVARRLKLPNVVTIQGLLSWYAKVVPETRMFERFMARLEPASLRRAGVVTTESSFAVNYLRERYPRLRVHQAEHAPNWLFSRIERRPRLSPPHLVVVGSLGYRKGTDLLLRALAALLEERPFKVTLVAGVNTTYLDALKPSLPSQLWERIEIKTHLSPEAVAAELATATLSIMPTRADTSPNAVKEAVVAGVPVVASAVGGIPDYVTHGENGLLFPAGDLPAFTRALREAFTHPLFGRGEVSPAALGRVRDYLSPEQMGRRFFEAYQLALSRAPQSG